MTSTTSTTNSNNIEFPSNSSNTGPSSTGHTQNTSSDFHTHVTPTFEQRRKLVLCFDGTNGTFKSNAGDSNIVKLCQLFDRRTEDQYHYYQPGIGTYTPAPPETSYTSMDLLQALNETLDLGFGFSFPSHVISGYNFLMRYYTPGSSIHIFGFSRGAYTARFLADMLFKIGLLSAGNEEMIQFAYRSYVSYLEAEDGSRAEEKGLVYMESFRETYGRVVKVDTLGLFDTVGSIAIFREGFPKVKEPPARHIRHAMAIDERRSRFRPTMFEWEALNRGELRSGSFKEEWFAGDHTDIGGGHYPDPQSPMPATEGDASKSLKGYAAEAHSIGNVALSWMVQEVIAIQKTLPEKDRLTWKEDEVSTLRKAAEEAAKARWHDNLDLRRMGPVAKKTAFKRGLAHLGNFVQWSFWWVLEFTPLWRPQFGRRRTVPVDAIIHPSVQVKIKNDPTYRPTNIPPKLLE